jgi:hypothetical protein
MAVAVAVGVLVAVEDDVGVALVGVKVGVAVVGVNVGVAVGVRVSASRMVAVMVCGVGQS